MPMEPYSHPEGVHNLSRAASGSSGKLRQTKKVACDEILKRLTESGNEAVNDPGFEEALYTHFQMLPIRYAMDVNPDRAEDVLEHKRLLEKARTIGKGSPVMHVRSIHVLPFGLETFESQNPSEKNEELVGSAKMMSMLAPPSFGSAANLEALALEMVKPAKNVEHDSNSSNDDSCSSKQHIPIHEITFSTKDRPKLLSELSSILAEVGLNIREAHVFSTDDGYSLDAFVVDGWPSEDTQELWQQLEAIVNVEKAALVKETPEPIIDGGSVFLSVDTTDDWEINLKLLKYNHKVASGSFGDLYKGTYCGQDVAIKVLQKERLNEDLQQEFAQEVSIMRKVRHKNVVQFIGACTRPPNLCIVTEFMSGGSVHDHLHKQGSFKLLELLKIAIDVSKGMDYLHQCNIIHRDLKAANLLMDEYGTVKVADFGVARVKAQTGVMTAETGTYRWMAPEVIEHLPYDHKADVFSFGIVVWELMTGKLPYEYLTPLQAAVGVVQKGLRPTIPKIVHPRLADLLIKCWKQNPADRLEFFEITRILQDILKEIIVADEGKKKKSGVFSLYKKKISN